MPRRVALRCVAFRLLQLYARQDFRDYDFHLIGREGCAQASAGAAAEGEEGVGALAGFEESVGLELLGVRAIARGDGAPGRCMARSITPAGSSWPAIVSGLVRMRPKFGITGSRRIVSLITASTYFNLPTCDASSCAPFNTEDDFGARAFHHVRAA